MQMLIKAGAEVNARQRKTGKPSNTDLFALHSCPFNNLKSNMGSDKADCKSLK
jgi:hypothetical protein